MSAEQRLWKVPMHPETGEVDLDVLAETLSEIGVFLRRGGGAVQMLARRAEDPDTGLHVTQHVDVMWTLHAPLPRKRKESPPPQPEDFGEPEPVEEGEPEPLAAVE